MGSPVAGNNTRRLAMYDQHILDNWLAQSAHGYASPPTTDDIMNGHVQLLTVQEVRLRLPNLQHDTIKRLAQIGRLPTLKLAPHCACTTLPLLTPLPTATVLYDGRRTQNLGRQHPNELRKNYIDTQRLVQTTDPLTINDQLCCMMILLRFCQSNCLVESTQKTGSSTAWLIQSGQCALSTP